MKNTFMIRWLITALMLCLTTTGNAHDIWLLPEQFTPALGDTLRVRQLAGDEVSLEPGKMEELPLLRRLTGTFEMLNSEGSIDLLAKLPSERSVPVIKPVFQRTMNTAGLTLLAMEHDFIYMDHHSTEFRKYLAHENLARDNYLAHMGERSIQRERYSRSIKSLLQVGSPEKPQLQPAGSQLHRRAIGQRIEIVLLQNPYLLKTGDELTAQVLFEGKPLPGKAVTAYHANEQGVVSSYIKHTDDNGMASFSLTGSGSWLLRLMHLLPCRDQSDVVACTDVDWESYWASFSFSLD
ncbi:DUF4198 domain-containing protein [Marinobacterium arenosum]|uniref:DUF4198 domain-containing protein n=1 Tax=Marinobacterium arenosum TaxID=2862496 RepID=UPI001C966D7C|nr:DUF4198 domain-containing protein [Marinobacterium arenosum]MBY4675245.1 DUF4198 domain-containing protein [Marinobacterium arenosum]